MYGVKKKKKKQASSTHLFAN